MVNGAPGEVPESTQCREKVEGPPRDLLKTNPVHIQGQTKAKTGGAVGPQGFGPLVWPRMWLWFGL